LNRIETQIPYPSQKLFNVFLFKSLSTKLYKFKNNKWIKNLPLSLKLTST